MTRDDDEAESGMMLAEVLVGLAILSLVSIAMLRILSGAALTAERIEGSRTRLAIAENLLAGLVAAGRAVPASQSGQTNGTPWSIESRALASEGIRGWKAYRIEIRVGDPGTPPLLSSVVLGVDQ